MFKQIYVWKVFTLGFLKTFIGILLLFGMHFFCYYLEGFYFWFPHHNLVPSFRELLIYIYLYTYIFVLLLRIALKSWLKIQSWYPHWAFRSQPSIHTVLTYYQKQLSPWNLILGWNWNFISWPDFKSDRSSRSGDSCDQIQLVSSCSGATHKWCPGGKVGN